MYVVHTRDMTTTRTATFTADIFDRFAERDDFLGFGYIGGRRYDWAPEDVAVADAAALARAAELRWSEKRLFTWANSKNGRWFADFALGCGDLDGAMRLVY